VKTLHRASIAGPPISSAASSSGIFCMAPSRGSVI
jgi:hypothetical protein